MHAERQVLQQLIGDLVWTWHFVVAQVCYDSLQHCHVSDVIFYAHLLNITFAHASLNVVLIYIHW